MGTASSLTVGKSGCGVKSHRSPDLKPRLITSVGASPPPIFSCLVKEKIDLDVYLRTILTFRLTENDKWLELPQKNFPLIFNEDGEIQVMTSAACVQSCIKKHEALI
jgi:hypothetical protein